MRFRLYGCLFLKMSFWFTASEEEQDQNPSFETKSFYGIFYQDPSFIGKTLIRPTTPFCPNSFDSSDEYISDDLVSSQTYSSNSLSQAQLF